MSAPSLAAVLAEAPREPWYDDETRPSSADGDDCQRCDELASQLAKAKALLRAIARTDAKPAKPELGDDPTDCVILGYSFALATIKARIQFFLERDGRRP